MATGSGVSASQVAIVIAGVIAATALAAVFVVGQRNKARDTAICASNQTGLYKAMYTYSIANRDRFPEYRRTATGSARGFALKSRDKTVYSNHEDLIDNVTAGFWLLVRDGSTSTRSWVCPDSGDEGDDLLQADGKPAMLENTYDFESADHLSYSPLNMYGSKQGPFWGPAAPGDQVIYADDNNNSHAQRHTSIREDSLSLDKIEGLENSTNHGGEGQIITFGDGHVDWVTHPYQGRWDDNIYALDTNDEPMTESAAAPRLGNEQELFMVETPEQDSMLIPLTGNGGQSLSGE